MSIRLAILDEAVKAVAAGGERALRVHDVARDVGCSVSALYVHFGSREGLAEAALIEHYRRRAATITEPLVAQLRRASSATAVKRALSTHVKALCSADQTEVHLARTELVAAAHRRETVREVLGEFEQSRQSQYVEAIQAARDRGVLRPGLDVDAAATLLRTSSLSQAMVNAHGDGSTQGWLQTLQRALEGALLA